MYRKKRDPYSIVEKDSMTLKVLQMAKYINRYIMRYLHVVTVQPI